MKELWFYSVSLGVASRMIALTQNGIRSSWPESVGADADLTKAPTFDCPTIGCRAQQRIQGHRAGSREIGRLGQFGIDVNKHHNIQHRSGVLPFVVFGVGCVGG